MTNPATQEETTGNTRRRSLGKVISFLDAYQPAEPEKLSLVNNLRDRLRQDPNRENALSLAWALEGTPFALKRGVIKPLPGLVNRVARSAESIGGKK